MFFEYLIYPYILAIYYFYYPDFYTRTDKIQAYADNEQYFF